MFDTDPPDDEPASLAASDRYISQKDADTCTNTLSLEVSLND